MSAKYLSAVEKAGVKPAASHDLPALRAIQSTGSPLTHEGFRYVYRDVKADVALASISGGTDLISCFALGCPWLPVHEGELQCAGLGMAVDVYDDDGAPVRGEKGELVCTQSFPSAPIGFWNDPGDAKYRDAYFNRYPNVWAHGDFAEITAHDGFIVHGRSDAVLNPGGVRIGTAEIYRQVEAIDTVMDCVAIGQDWDGDTRIVSVRRVARGRNAGHGPRERDQAANPRTGKPSPRPRGDRRRTGHPAYIERQDRRTRGARRRAWTRGGQHDGHGEPRGIGGVSESTRVESL